MRVIASPTLNRTSRQLDELMRGHHPLSGQAFDHVNYDDAMAIGKVFMRQQNWGHPQPLTSYQQQGYLAFAKTGEPLTLLNMAPIEIGAMVKAGVPRQFAEEAVSAAIWERITNGQTTPTFIPWGGRNPGVP